MSEPKLISPLLDGFVMGDPISKHHGVCCCPAMELSTENKYIVKFISVPASQVQLDALLLSGAYSSKEDALAYFSQMSETVCQEAKLLKRLSELEGFAGYTDWQVVPMEDGTGFDVYLLGSYRKTLERQFHQEPMTHLGAVNLGLDLCAALTVARRTGNLYVDLKPSNVYITENGEYQIGDLGFIPLDSLKYASLPEKYHSSYTAPEVTDAYSSLNDTLDTYAVGLILYQAFNNNTLPYSSYWFDVNMMTLNEEENEVYTEFPNRAQLRYIDTVVEGVSNREEELNQQIQTFSIGWDISRISKLTRCIMQLAIFETLYLEDVPVGVAVSEAVRLAKKYDGDDTGSFVNGILGSFARSLNAPEAEEAK